MGLAAAEDADAQRDQALAERDAVVEAIQQLRAYQAALTIVVGEQEAHLAELAAEVGPAQRAAEEALRRSGSRCTSTRRRSLACSRASRMSSGAHGLVAQIRYAKAIMMEMGKGAPHSISQDERESIAWS